MVALAFFTGFISTLCDSFNICGMGHFLCIRGWLLGIKRLESSIPCCSYDGYYTSHDSLGHFVGMDLSKKAMAEAISIGR